MSTDTVTSASSSTNSSDADDKVSYTDDWAKVAQEKLLNKGVEHTVYDRCGKDIFEDSNWRVFEDSAWNVKKERFPLTVKRKTCQDDDVLNENGVLDEKVVINFEEALLKLRKAGAPGAGQLSQADRDLGLDDFAVAFGGGGVRSGAFCSGVLWALAENNRLRHVTHLSSVSGGSTAASGFASFLLQADLEKKLEEYQQRSGSEDREPEPYRAQVANFIERSQCNAGYLLSFKEGCSWGCLQVPEDKSSKYWRCCDLVMFVLVIVGVLFVGPFLFTIFYIVPVTVLIEAYWGGAMRFCFCSSFHEKEEEQCSILGAIQPRGNYTFRIILGLLIAMIISVVLQQCCLCFKCCFRGKKFDPEAPRTARSWRSLTRVLTIWVVVLLMVQAAVALVYTAEKWDRGQMPAEEGKRLCDAYYHKGPHCSFFLPEIPKHVTETELVDLGHSAFEKARPGNGAMRLPNFILTCTLILVLVALIAKMLGWMPALSPIWRVVLWFLLPCYCILPSSFLLQWRIFGPITKQALLFPFFQEKLWGEYTDQAWSNFTTISLAMAIVLLPFFPRLHRFVHIYFRRSMQRAFYHDGENQDMSKIALCPSVPILLFGATLNEFATNVDDEPHCLFSLSQYAMGCERTGYLPSPCWLTLARCMALSCAAIDGFVLTQINMYKWHTRILMAALNLTQGDWVRFDRGQKPWCKRFFKLEPSDKNLTRLDRIPEFILFTLIYLGCVLANQRSRPLNGSHSMEDMEVECEPFRLSIWLSMALIMVFIGILSFFGHCPYLNWLLDSPLIRQMHMFFIFHEVNEEAPMYLYLTDGGPVEDLGLVQLLRRKRRWILSFDCGDDPRCDLIDLHAAMNLARKENICSFYLQDDPRLDLESHLNNFKTSEEKFLHLGVLYSPDESGEEQVGEIIHVRMRLLKDDNVLVKGLVKGEDVEKDVEKGNTRPPQRGGSESSSALLDQEGMELMQMQQARRPGDLQQEEMTSSNSSDSSNPGELPRRSLGGICCECCHDIRYPCRTLSELCSDCPSECCRCRCERCHDCRCPCGVSCAICGSFPDTHTVNQFFTPKVWANFCHLGHEMALPAIQRLTERQKAVAAERRSQRSVPVQAARG